MSKNIFSAIAHLFAKKEHVREPRVPEPTPPSKTTAEPPPPSPASPVPRVSRKKTAQKAKQPKQVKHKKPRADYDKKGFRIITDKDDLSQLFQAGEAQNKKAHKEDFSRLFERSQTDVYQRRMLEEKIVHREPQPPTSATGRIKSYPPPQEELDLHGYTAAEAGAATENFIRGARMRKIRTLRIITGKGLHSDGKAVLPDVVGTKIIELKRDRLVLAYKWEKKDKRKSGAMIVYL